ncbi:MAG: DNA helicase II [Pseudomonadota bacterium]
MDLTPILNHLNDDQRKAVTSEVDSDIMVIAGAGSGKTRVLTRRIAWLIQVMQVPATAILAVTFTNKAAHEMRSRVEELLHMPVRNMWIGTFHGLCHRMLRLHYADADLVENFQVMDSDDQYRLIRRLLKSMGLDEGQWSPKEIQWFINKKKDDGLRPDKVPHYDNLHTKTLISIYQNYQTTCEKIGVVDFAELLLRVCELLQKHEALRQHYQRRFKKILVDEFQDTNQIQYRWLNLFRSETNDYMLVGDDDQSIYGWRGASRNIERYLEDYPQTEIIRLEQNYRSTTTILQAANAIIANNQSRLGKQLWTSGHHGEPIRIYAAYNDLDEAKYVATIVKKWLQDGNRRDECAILYRSNAQSRVLEEAFIQANIAYRVYGGLRFYERAEIKDTLAYMRLIVNPNDDSAFERIINTPTRGIGHATLEHLRQLAKTADISLWQACLQVIETKSLSARALNALERFVSLISDMAQTCAELELAEIVEHVIHHSGLHFHYQKEKGEKARTRLENLDELVTAAKTFTSEESSNLLQAFLANAALEAGEGQADEHTDYVQLMTLHSAKGLEFPLVVLTGMEDGLFPHQMCLDELKQLEEERRLCYVGITRAKQQLFMTYAEIRRQHGREMYHKPSRFIREIPAELLEEIRLQTKISRPVSLAMNTRDYFAAETAINIGAHVLHQKFGEGIVMAFEGQGDNARVQVRFSDQTRWLLASFVEVV